MSWKSTSLHRPFLNNLLTIQEKKKNPSLFKKIPYYLHKNKKKTRYTIKERKDHYYDGHSPIDNCHYI